MTPENPSDSLPSYVRFLSLVLGTAVAGAVLYALFPFLPAVVQVFLMLAACLIAMKGNSKPMMRRASPRFSVHTLQCLFVFVLFASSYGSLAVRELPVMMPSSGCGSWPRVS
jgi:hypothetical protein